MDKTLIPWKDLPDSEKERHRVLYNAHNEKGLNFFFLHLYQPIFDYVYRMIKDLGESKDIAQQCFIDVWYARNRPLFDNANKLKSYHFTAARNKCITFLTRLGKYKPEDFDDEMPDGPPDHLFQRTEDKEFYNLVLKHIHQLPEPKKGIVLARIEGLSYDEIGRRYNLSERRVGTILSRTWQWVRQQLPRLR